MSIEYSVTACYDHLGGIAGERLTEAFLTLGWITDEPMAGVTPAGWTGFAGLGMNLVPLTTARRRPVAYCIEARGPEQHHHLGGHLGAMVRHHFLRQGWLRLADDGLTLTAEGEHVLHTLGIKLEEKI